MSFRFALRRKKHLTIDSLLLGVFHTISKKVLFEWISFEVGFNSLLFKMYFNSSFQ